MKCVPYILMNFDYSMIGKVDQITKNVSLRIGR